VHTAFMLIFHKVCGEFGFSSKECMYFRASPTTLQKLLKLSKTNFKGRFKKLDEEIFINK